MHGCDPSAADLLYAGRIERKLRMEGRAVYRHAVARMVQATSEALERAGLADDRMSLNVARVAGFVWGAGIIAWKEPDLVRA